MNPGEGIRWLDVGLHSVAVGNDCEWEVWDGVNRGIRNPVSNAVFTETDAADIRRFNMAAGRFELRGDE